MTNPTTPSAASGPGTSLLWVALFIILAAVAGILLWKLRRRRMSVHSVPAGAEVIATSARHETARSQPRTEPHTRQPAALTPDDDFSRQRRSASGKPSKQGWWSRLGERLGKPLGKPLGKRLGKPFNEREPKPAEQRRPRAGNRTEQRRPGLAKPPEERRSPLGGGERNNWAAAAPDPQLTAPVLLEAAWQQSVYHGARNAGGVRVAVRVATARGRSHAYEGTAGQDVAGAAWNEHRRSVFAVVGDGLGSKTDSGVVARILVEEALERAVNLGAYDDPTEMVNLVFDAVEAKVRYKGLDGATTVVVAEISPEREHVAVTTWGVGDSEAWLMHDGDWHVLHHERRADGQNVTRHLPGHREVHPRRTLVRYGSVVTLASDGFAGALGENSALARDLAGRWRKPPPPMDFLRQVNFDDPYFHDDRAAVAVWIQ